MWRKHDANRPTRDVRQFLIKFAEMPVAPPKRISSGILEQLGEQQMLPQ